MMPTSSALIGSLTNPKQRGTIADASGNGEFANASRLLRFLIEPGRACAKTKNRIPAGTRGYNRT